MLSLLYFLIQEGRTPLWCAAIDGHSDIVQLLLKLHADIDLPDKVMLGCGCEIHIYTAHKKEGYLLQVY